MLEKNPQKLNPWQAALINAITDPLELLRVLDLPLELLAPALAAGKLFPLKVPRGFVARMEKGNLQDPLLLQVLPILAELDQAPGFEADPLQEKAANPVPGLLHKYQGRVLVTLTGVCAINCRYCFRRAFPYEENNPGKTGLEKILDYIAADLSLSEVILSGGDPLVVSDSLLNYFVDKLSILPHIKRLRIHSRIPIVLPQRITPELLKWMTDSRLQMVVVTHANHPQELNAEVADAIAKLRHKNITLLNQAVLLQGINDNLDALCGLSARLFEIGVLPYYLHVLDKVTGSAHFDLPRAKAAALHAGMLERLPGYLVPKLACEQPGAPSKIWL